MAKMLIPKITPAMMKYNPDQVTNILNRLIADVNYLNGLGIESAVRAANARPEPTPTPSSNWRQDRIFDPAKMGHRAGWCLMNCRLGFGIATGHFASARKDMEDQRRNGTLHTGTPPIDIQVPVYIDTGVAAGHVVVWDKGTVYSDGEIVPDGLAHWENIWGWGELCDNRRVVSQVA